jgi:hypothetical protein
MEKNSGYSYSRRPEGREASLTGAEGQVSGRVFQRPISKFNFRAKTSLCLFSSTSFLSLLVFSPLLTCSFSFFFLPFPLKERFCKSSFLFLVPSFRLSFALYFCFLLLCYYIKADEERTFTFGFFRFSSH